MVTAITCTSLRELLLEMNKRMIKHENIVQMFRNEYSGEYTVVYYKEEPKAQEDEQ